MKHWIKLAVAVIAAAAFTSIAATYAFAHGTAARGTTVKVAKSRLAGSWSTAGESRCTTSSPTSTGRSSCYGACEAYWPPLLTKGKPHAGTGVRASLLGTTKRKDGKLEVTYNHHPLYYFVGDGSRPDDGARPESSSALPGGRSHRPERKSTSAVAAGHGPACAPLPAVVVISAAAVAADFSCGKPQAGADVPPLLVPPACSNFLAPRVPARAVPAARSARRVCRYQPAGRLQPPSAPAPGSTVDGIFGCCGGCSSPSTFTPTWTVFVTGSPRNSLRDRHRPPVEVQPTTRAVRRARCCVLLAATRTQPTGSSTSRSPIVRTYSLGDFFDIWHEPLGPARVGPARGKVTAFFDAVATSEIPRGIPLLAHAQIQLDVGRPLVAAGNDRLPSGL
jgi:predicted lipoprotein with Yx(FWY)xxD motif